MLAAVAMLGLTYLVAAVPFGLVVTTLYGDDVDIRGAGSGNIGATNVARLYGWRLAAPVVALDVAKGFAPVALAQLMWPEWGGWWPGLVALVAFWGHCRSVFLEFRGGKGVATGAGGLLAVAPLPTLGAAAVWITVVAITGRSSIGALTAVLSAVGLVAWLDPQTLGLVGLIAASVAVTHISNIRRIVKGEEKQVINPVRWRRSVAAPTAEHLLEQAPSGASLGPALWREAAGDPLEVDEELPGAE